MSRPPRTVVYVANADSHDISVLAFGDGSDPLVEIERFDCGGRVMPLAVAPDRRVLHASIRTAPFRVLSLAIEPADGRLQALGEAPLPASMCWISTDRRGRFLLSAAYEASLVAVSPIGSDGIARPAQQVIPTEPNAHAIQVDPANRFAFATSLGGDLIRQFRFDADSGRLDDNEPPAWRGRAGAGPRHFAFHPALPIVYLLNELDGSVEVLSFDTAAGRLSSTQTLSALPGGAQVDKPWAADLHLTPDGRFLYASERRTSTLAGFAVDAASGHLTPLGSMPTETEPRGFAISPDGRLLIAVGQASHRLSRYAIDATTGALSKLGDQPVGQGPNWVEVVDLPA
ncbi:MAG TPA: beta-propeller fold lactonase family protein [Caldimonas sp.]|jgi:6-phosphogluconolactonase|nr:beta-propeller fold lactonase family protein [Caldimonas sp.]HEX2543023.1 beta-propeller fold lactonase family protein [Caldimonas sp.]